MQLGWRFTLAKPGLSFVILRKFCDTNNINIFSKYTLQVLLYMILGENNTLTILGATSEQRHGKT